VILRELTVPGRPHLRVLRTTTSTNDDAAEWARQGAVDGATVVADQQTGGRGRLGRSWISPPGVNLYLSQVILAPVNRLRLIPLMGGMAVHDAVAEALPASLEAGIKWPNDILVSGSKVAGVLAEMVTEPPAGILGIGINLNMEEEEFSADLRRPGTSLMVLCGGQEQNRRQFLQRLLEHLDTWRSRLHDTPEKLVERFTQRCLTLHKRVEVSLPGEAPFSGQAVAIDPDGALLVRDASGTTHRVEAGDVDGEF
jgi:BirA family biotin operon repressor/biotin-[acetyl-CoA-carboxylase] ligase